MSLLAFLITSAVILMVVLFIIATILSISEGDVLTFWVIMLYGLAIILGYTFVTALFWFATKGIVSSFLVLKTFRSMYFTSSISSIK